MEEAYQPYLEWIIALVIALVCSFLTCYRGTSS